jgi:tyrosine-protein kinase Etk/Wzc
MTPPSTIVAGVLRSPWFRDSARRRISFAAICAILAVLCFFPRHYLARAQLLPQSPGGGLSAMLSGGANGGLLSLGALLGQRQSIEVELAVARSHAVAVSVIDRLHLTRRAGFHDPEQAAVKLQKKVDIEAVRGSIILISVRDPDPRFAMELASAYSASIQDRLANLNRRQTASKQAVAETKLSETTLKLARAQAALSRFRDANKMAAPEGQLGAAVFQLGALQGRLQAEQVELGTLLRFATNDNVDVMAARAEIASLQSQISQSLSQSGSPAAAGLAAMAAKDTEYFNLYRDEQFAQVLYQVYTRYLESTTIDEMSAGDNVDVIDLPYLEPAWQINIVPLGLLAITLLLGAALELYLFRPPAGWVRHGA